MVVRNRLLGRIFGAFESISAAPGAEPIDEYRELAILAHAWERGTLEPRAAKRVTRRIDDAERKVSASGR